MLDLTNINFTNLCLDVARYLKLNQKSTITSALALLIVIRIYQNSRRPRTPRLQGPASEGFLYGITRKLFPSSGVGFIYQEWEKIYGPVYEVPASFGSRHIVLGDPKAITHLFSKDTTTYYQPAVQRAVGRRLFGEILVAVEGETHRRQRRALASAFSISALRDITPVFLDSANQLKAAWDSSIQSSDNSTDGVIIDIQKWMNCIALDNIGNAGFSHDFGTLKGKTPSLMTAFNSFSAVKPSLPIRLSLLVGPLFPNLFARIPNQRKVKLREVAASLRVIALDLLDKASKETGDKDVDRSILAVMIRSENASSNIRMSTDEIIAQNMFMLAGYETSAITLTWALVELARRPEIQNALRAELRAELGDLLAHEEEAGPTYDQLMNGLPYLDAFTCELLRLRLPEPQTMREANEDDVIPLTYPIRTASGTMVDSLYVEKGTVVRIPFAGVNMSEALWGPDAGRFDPGRWLVSSEKDGKKGKRREEVKGYRNLLTFAYGPRICPARNFAVAELKAVLSVLVRRFSFAFPNGPETKLESNFLRPKVVGEDGPRVPILVRRVGGGGVGDL